MWDVTAHKRRWSKHKSDWKRGNRTSRLAPHGQDVNHPDDPDLMFLNILPAPKTVVKVRGLVARKRGFHKFCLNREIICSLSVETKTNESCSVSK